MKRRYPPVLIVVLAMWILVTVSTTVVMAYMFRKTPTVNNQFDPASVACQVNETFENDKKSNVTVANNGNITSYIRLRVITYWVDSKGNVVARSAPENKFIAASDANKNDETEYWLYDDNTWLYDESEQTFYCKTPVNATAYTPELLKLRGDFEGITLVKVTENVNGIEYTYHPVIEFIAEAIQSKPVPPAVEYDKSPISKWGITVDANGIITATP